MNLNRSSKPHSQSRANELSALLFSLEHFNTYFARQQARSDKDLKPEAVLLQVRDYLMSCDQWPNSSPTLGLALELQKVPPANESAESLVSATIDTKGNDSGNPTRPLPPPHLPIVLYDKLWLHERDGRGGFSTVRVPNPQTPMGRETGETGLLYSDECIDPVMVAHRTLLERPQDGETERVKFLLQRWIRRSFRMRYGHHSRALIFDLVARVNELFFGQTKPARSSGKLPRTATISTGLLLEELSTFLEQRLRRLADSGIDIGLLPGQLSQQRSSEYTLGIFYFLRFCGFFRVRYCWPSKQGALESGLGSYPWPLQSLSAYRPLEYGHTLVRIFGSLSDISGLNFVFRGGLLPRVDSGRTMAVYGPPGSGKTLLALQKLAGIASRGGMAAYFSFEEGYELLISRLLTFGLEGQQIFKVVEYGSAEYEALGEERPPERREGVLVLYGQPQARKFSIWEAIDSLDKLASRFWPWKAIAIDSIDALGFRDSFERSFFRKAARLRTQLKGLVEKLEYSGFLGILLAEDNSERADSLRYLADTVLHLGFEDNKQGRWIEIEKCRTQNFHPGKHPFRLMELQGFKIYPSLAAVRSSLRRRVPTGLSSNRAILLKLSPNDKSPHELLEKSSTLIYGPASAGKTALVLRLAIHPSVNVKNTHDDRAMRYPQSVLIVTFRTSQTKFMQTLRTLKGLEASWRQLMFTEVRSYGPGSNITAAQIVADIRRTLKAAKMSGYPIERIVFDEVESADHSLPRLGEEPLFWPTILALVASEAQTAFFVFEYRKSLSEALSLLRAEVDYTITQKGSDSNKDSEGTDVEDVTTGKDRFSDGDCKSRPGTSKTVSNEVLQVTEGGWKFEKWPDMVLGDGEVDKGA